MFDRLLGPKTDHADPKVRAKAYSLDSVDEATLNAALGNEQDADVLCVILSRATAVPAVLVQATQSAGSIANEARTRLVTLATQNAVATVDDWRDVYSAAYTQDWTQVAALHDALNVSSGSETVLEGALTAQPEPARLEERVLIMFASHSQSSRVRRLAASNVHSDKALEACCDALKDKDKNVYRDVKERLDARKRLVALKTQAVDLSNDIEKLRSLSVTAQPESLAVAQARRQTLEERIQSLCAEDAELGGPLKENFTRVVSSVDASIHAARDQASKRKALKVELKTLQESLQDADAAHLAECHVRVERIVSDWQEIPDHTDLDKQQFDSLHHALRTQLGALTADRDVHAGLVNKIALWTEKMETDVPDALRRTVEREWQTCEKPQNEEQRANLQQQVQTLLDKLEQKTAQLARQRATNSEHMLKILEDFNAKMEAGEFKKAMSLNDKLKARAANRELEPAAKKNIEDALKRAQPRLEEFRKWRHFGTQQARDNLIGQANTLISDPPASPKALSVQVKALREAWRKLDQDDGRASETVWQTFSKACKEAYKPAKKHFDQLAKERKGNLATRKAVLEKLQLLLDDTDWSRPDWASVTKAHRELQQEWQRSGTIDYKIKKDVDAQYAKLSEQFDAQFKEEREFEVQRRQRLIDRLREAQSGEIDGRLASAAKRAQREWRPTVQSDRKTEQTLWKEFRAICDGIFDALKTKQKETKAAWQAEAKDRESLCAEVDQLLSAPSDSGEDEAQLARQAKGKLNELTKQWRTRHQIPSGIASKLDARFKQAQQSALKRITNVLAQETAKQEERLSDLLDVCQSAEEDVFAGRDTLSEFESKLNEFKALRGVVGKGLFKRLQQAVTALGGDTQAADALKRATKHNLTERQELCLRGELVADIASPASVESERMELKMKRLTQAMQGELVAPERELEQIAERWFLVGGVDSGEWQPLKARFAQVQAARR